MSFINLMADDVWSEADIVNRTEAMVRSKFSAQEEVILNRKVLGASMNFTLSPADQAEVGEFQATVLAAQFAGQEARADMALLNAVLAFERGEDEGLGAGIPAVVGLTAQRAAARSQEEA